MVQLTGYGGVNEIGGNKLLLEDGGKSLLLDFGFPYARYKQFYEEYLKPRSGAGLLDPLAMGLLPPLEGLYRDDLAAPGLWKQFQNNPGYRRLDEIDGVLLTHAHLDHSGYISFLREDIPVYTTATTAFIAKAMQDSGKSGLEQQTCYFTPTVYECPSGWEQAACLSSKEAKCQRQFCLADIEPEALGAEAKEFWERGFWEKTTRQKEIIFQPLLNHSHSSFNLRCFPVDHSIPGASAWGIETSSGWIIYSGDLRLHGKRGELTRRFIEEAAKLHPRVLIMEGTNVQRPTNVTEAEVSQNAYKAIASSNSLIIADFGARDADRLLTFLDIARDRDRKLVILPKDAYLLKTLNLIEPQVPDLAHEDNIAIYQETTGDRSPDLWQRNIFQDYKSKTVLAEDIRSAPEKFILCFSFFDLNELPSIQPKPGSLYLFSSSEPHDEEQEIDFRRLWQWLEHFQLKGFGLPREVNRDWLIPDSEKGLHASGHACASDLLKIAREIKPEVLIPVHSQNPGFYVENLSREMKITLPVLQQPIEI